MSNTATMTTSEWVKNVIKQDEIHRYLIDGKDFINDDLIWKQLKENNNPSRERIDTIIEKARNLNRLDPEETAGFPEQGRPGGWMVWAQYISLGQRYDLRPALADVNVPVLVIHGAADLQSEAASRMYAEAFPNSEFVVIPEVSHFSFEEQPEEFAQIVANFLSSVTRNIKSQLELHPE